MWILEHVLIPHPLPPPPPPPPPPEEPAIIHSTWSTWRTCLVWLLCLCEGWFTSLLHQGAGECREAEVILHDADYLPQKPPQGSKVVLLPSKEVLEDATQQLHDVMMM